MIYKNIGIFLAILLGLCVGYYTIMRDDVHPLEGATAKIGIVDIEVILAAPKKKLHEQLDGIVQKYHEEFKGYEIALRAESQELVEQQKNLKDASMAVQQDWAQRKNAFDARVLETQKNAEQRRHILSKAHQNILDKIHNTLLELIQEEGRKQEMDLMISAQQAIYWRSSLNLTPIIQARLVDILMKQSFDLVQEQVAVMKSEAL